MPVTLYFLEYGPPSRAVALAAHALDLEVELKHISMMKNEHLTPEYLKISPLHSIPTLVDQDGFVLWESHAMMTYLVDKYGKDDSLYPKDLKKRAIVDQRLHFSNDVFNTLKLAAKPLLYQNAKTIPAEAMDKIREMQESVEKLLEGSKFMAGDQLTVADFSFVTMLDVLEIIYPAEGKYPLTKAWFARCKTTIKDFEKVNGKGSKEMISILKEKLPM